MDVREKLALAVCNATKKTNYRCDFKCEKKGKCAYCLVMAEQMIAHGVTVQEMDGCDFCQKFDFAGARAEVNKYGAHISLAICNTKLPDEERFKFCPMCGRRLPQPPKGE